ncbi:MAG: hypothetical protein LUQ69_07200 [Methanoregulaceae archaeon]|nr:hypothetical protein [Methanoregulaceae archaeon]
MWHTPATPAGSEPIRYAGDVVRTIAAPSATRLYRRTDPRRSAGTAVETKDLPEGRGAGRF